MRFYEREVISLGKLILKKNEKKEREKVKYNQKQVQKKRNKS